MCRRKTPIPKSVTARKREIAQTIAAEPGARRPLRAEHLRYIRQEAAESKKKKLENFRHRTEEALQVFDDAAVMVRFADILASRGGAFMQKQLIEQIISRLRDGRASSKSSIIGIDLAKLPGFCALRQNFQKCRETLIKAYESGVQRIEQEVDDFVDDVYLGTMPEDCAAKLREFKESPLPDLPEPAVV